MKSPNLLQKTRGAWRRGQCPNVFLDILAGRRADQNKAYILPSTAAHISYPNSREAEAGIIIVSAQSEILPR